MNKELINKTITEDKTIDSREVAEMMNTEHKYILRSIEGTDSVTGIIPTLEKSFINYEDYFIKSTYKAGTREYKCYLCTIEGVSLIIDKCHTYKNKIKLIEWINNNSIQRITILKDRKEIEFLEKLEESLKPFEITGERQYQVKNENGTNYRIDYYIPELNIAIEYDENGHADYTYEQHEGRQEYIENKLGCNFIRVSDKESDEYNIGIVLKEIFEMNNNKCNLCGCNMELLNGKYICSNCGSTKKYNPVYKF